MNESSLQSQIEGAQAYEALFVPALFGQWVGTVVDAARIRAGQRALDVACGTGILARGIASQVGESGYVAGLDPNPGMLAVAIEHAPTVDWKQGVAESIPYPDYFFDAVLSQFGLMFFSDRRQSIREFLRVLKPAGRLAVAVLDSIENIPGYSTELALIEKMAGQSAGDAVRAPFELGDRKKLSDLFEDAGAASIEIVTHRGTARFPSIRTMVEAELRGWLPIMGVHLSEKQIGQILQEAERELAPYVTSTGAVVFDVAAHVVTARRP
jgi:ubiquinone/menaquinone biosynthesis C-methylase UbiE